MGLIQFNGDPGTTWTNEGDKLRYQLIVSWSNSCGICIQYDHAIGHSWPIPFHRNCRCRQLAIFPGKESDPFVDFREKILELEPSQRSKVVGASNLRLIEEGVVNWQDVVTQGRIRDLREVVSLKSLDLKTLQAAGVPKAQAVQAVESVDTPAHRLATEARRRLLEAMKEKGISDEDLRRTTAERLAERMTVSSKKPGPRPPEPPRPPPSPPPVPPKPPTPKPAPKPGASEIESHLGVKLKSEIRGTIGDGRAPNGGRFSEIVGVPDTPGGRLYKLVLDAIDKVHGLGNSRPEKIPILEHPGLKSWGLYSFGGFDLESKVSDDEHFIAMRNDIPAAPLALAHEFGHFIDYEGIRVVPQKDRRSITGQFLFDAWHKAVEKSPTVKKIQASLLGNLTDNMRAYHQYSLDKNELWARSYSQYIAVRSGDPALLQSIKIFEEHAIPQWSDEEFEPIAAEIDEILAAIGWRK